MASRQGQGKDLFSKARRRAVGVLLRVADGPAVAVRDVDVCYVDIHKSIEMDGPIDMDL